MGIGTWEERGPSVRPGRRLDAGLASFIAVAAVTLLVELALVERKFAIFGGGFGQARTIDAPLEIAAFAAGLATSQLLLLYALFRFARRLHGAGEGGLFLFNALFLIPAVLIGLLAAKYRLLSYFSDAIGFQVVRNLGGGSLVEAFLYILSEAGLLAIGLAAAAAFYWICLRLVRRYAPRDIRIAFPPPLGRKTWLAVALALPPLVVGINAAGDARYALARFNAYALMAGALHQVTDVDRDGYSLFSWRIDRHPFDGSRHPLALDVPNNGIDEDGLAGDFILEAAPEPISMPTFPAHPKHVVLLVLESVRAEVVDKRIDGRLVAPNIAALAASGTSVDKAYSHVGFTTFSLKTLFTGELTPRDDRHSLFRLFKDKGYRVGVISAQAEDFGEIAATVGMRRGDVFVDAGVLKDERVFDFATDASLKLDGRVLLREFDRHFGRADGWERQPTFLYMNLQASHFPYHHPGMPQIIAGEPIPRGSIDAEHKDWVARTYWNAVAYDDWLIGKLVGRLKAMGVYDDSLIVILADHGESLFDDGFLGHGHMINAQQTHIPLIFSQAGVGIAGPVGLDDVRGLILRLVAGQASPAAPAPVFQYIGSLDAPSYVGLVEPGGAQIVVDLQREVIDFDDGQGGRLYDELPAEGALRARADRLIHEWERQRWLSHEAAE